MVFVVLFARLVCDVCTDMVLLAVIFDAKLFNDVPPCFSLCSVFFFVIFYVLFCLPFVAS